MNTYISSKVLSFCSFYVLAACDMLSNCQNSWPGKYAALSECDCDYYCSFTE